MNMESGLLHKLALSGLADFNRDPDQIDLNVPESLEFPNELGHIMEDIRARIDECGMPEHLHDNPFFSFAVIQSLEEEDLWGKKNIIPFIPWRLDRKWVDGNIRKIAASVSTGTSEAPIVERAIMAIRNVLLWNLGKNLKLFDETPIIRTDMGHAKKKGHISSKAIREGMHKTKEKIDTDATLDPDIELLKELGILEGNEDMEKIKNDVRTCIRKAWKFYEELGWSLAKAQAEFGIGGEQVRVDPSYASKAMGLHDLLAQAVESGETNKTGAALLRHHQAQTIAYLTFLFLHVTNHPAYQTSRKLQEKYRLNIGTALFGRDENLKTEKVHMDSKRNIVSTPDPDDNDGIYSAYDTRTLQVDESGRKYRVWFGDVRTKTEESILKRIINSPDFDYEDIPDIIAGRIVLWDLNKEDLLADSTDSNETETAKNQRMKDLEKIARKIGESLGLVLEFIEREKLPPGRFCIKNKLGENGESEMYAYKLYGLSKDGVRIEFQIIPRDVFNDTNSWQSPNNHDLYDLQERVFPAVVSVYRQSSSPRIHEVAREAKIRLRDRKERGRGLYRQKIC